jgi:hypothetical protein
LIALSKKGRAVFYNSADALKAIYRSGESSKERLDAARAEIAELELGERRGELFRKEAIDQRDQKRIFAARARLLSIPSRVVGQIAPPSKLQQAEDVLTAAIYEALAELAGEDGDGNRH